MNILPSLTHQIPFRSLSKSKSLQLTNKGLKEFKFRNFRLHVSWMLYLTYQFFTQRKTYQTEVKTDEVDLVIGVTNKSFLENRKTTTWSLRLRLIGIQLSARCFTHFVVTKNAAPYLQWKMDKWQGFFPVTWNPFNWTWPFSMLGFIPRNWITNSSCVSLISKIVTVIFSPFLHIRNKSYKIS